MKRITDKIKTALSGNKGETLVESLVSIVIFTICTVGVTLMIRTGLLITKDAIVESDNMQKAVNDLVAGNLPETNGIFTLKGDGVTGNVFDIDVTMAAKKAEKTVGSMMFTAFGPDYTEFFNVTILFPGFDDIQIRYYQDGVWKGLGTYHQFAKINLPVGTYILQASITVPTSGMWYEFPSITGVADGVMEYEVPIKKITVTGKAAGFDLGVAMVGGNWVYMGSAIKTEFDVFDNGRIYNVHIQKAGFSQIILPVTGDQIDISEYFYTITVPAGYSLVRIQQNNWIISAASAGTEITMLKNGATNAKMEYTFGGNSYSYTFTLDGSNPFTKTDLPHLP